MSKRMHAWGVIHNSHGPSVDTVCFLPAGEKPDTDFAWARLPWLDEPERKSAADFSPDDVATLYLIRGWIGQLHDRVNTSYSAGAVALLDKILSQHRTRGGEG